MKHLIKLTLGGAALIAAMYLLIAWYCVYSNNVYQDLYYQGFEEYHLYK